MAMLCRRSGGWLSGPRAVWTDGASNAISQLLRLFVLWGGAALHGTPAHALTEALTEEQICEGADIVVIGVVTEVVPDWVEGPRGDWIVSQVTLEVERMIHGPSLSYIEVEVPGGIINDDSLKVGGIPIMAYGERYLLLLHSRASLPPTIFGGSMGVHQLDVEATLPSQNDLVEIWEEHCVE